MRGTVAAALGAAALGTIVVLLLTLPGRLLGPDRLGSLAAVPALQPAAMDRAQMSDPAPRC